MTILSPKDLDELYKKWRTTYESSPNSSFYPLSYRNVTRHGIVGKRFEDWLWGNGFKVVQREKERWLEFNGNEKQLTFFLLKHMS